MKVCILTSVHTIYDPRIYFKQAVSLSKAGYGVTLVARHNKDEKLEDIGIIALPPVKKRFIRIMRTPEFLFAAWKQKADIYHFHDPELIPIGLLIKMTMKTKVIYDVHEDYSEAILNKQWIPSCLRRIISSLFNFFEKQSARHLNYIITATDNIAGNFNNINHVSAIKNYPIIERFNNPVVHKSSTYNLVYAGALTAERGIGEIIQALSFISTSKDINLFLYGKFEPQSYQNSVFSMNGFDRVNYMGWVHPDELWKKLAQADAGIICLHPLERYKISLPIKLFEYMAAGLPVIASNFQVWNEIIEKHNCGLVVNPLDPEAISKAIEYLMDHRETARQMGKNGSRAVAEKYNWAIESKKLLNIYAELLGIK